MQNNLNNVVIAVLHVIYVPAVNVVVVVAIVALTRSAYAKVVLLLQKWQWVKLSLIHI